MVLTRAPPLRRFAQQDPTSRRLVDISASTDEDPNVELWGRRRGSLRTWRLNCTSWHFTSSRPPSPASRRACASLGNQHCSSDYGLPSRGREAPAPLKDSITLLAGEGPGRGVRRAPGGAPRRSQKRTRTLAQLSVTPPPTCRPRTAAPWIAWNLRHTARRILRPCTPSPYIPEAGEVRRSEPPDPAPVPGDSKRGI